MGGLYPSGWFAAYAYIGFRQTCRLARASAVMTRKRAKVLSNAFSETVPDPKIVQAIMVHWLALRCPFARAWNYDLDVIDQRKLWFEALHSMHDVYRLIPLELRRKAFRKAKKSWERQSRRWAAEVPIMEVSSDEDLDFDDSEDSGLYSDFGDGN